MLLPDKICCTAAVTGSVAFGSAALASMSFVKRPLLGACAPKTLRFAFHREIHFRRSRSAIISGSAEFAFHGDTHLQSRKALIAFHREIY